MNLPSKPRKRVEHECCEGECNHDDCCGKIPEICPLNQKTYDQPTYRTIMKKENFGEKIKRILKENGYNNKIRYFPNEYERKGKKIRADFEKVIVYAGRSIEKLASKRSRKLVAWKNEKGEWEGDLDVVKQQEGKGSSIYLLDYHDKKEPLKYVIYNDYDWNDDEEYAKNLLLKMVAKWKFVEEERVKLTPH